MKRFLLSAIITFSFLFARSATITWDGGGDGVSWNDANNWTGNILPAGIDDVVLDNSVVAGTYTVDLPAGAVTVTINSLTIAPSGGNVITLILPGSNTASPGLNITGPGDAMIINANGIFKNSSGAAASPVFSIANTFRINNNGKYIHNTQRAHSGIVSQLSTVAGTEKGIVEFDVAASATYILSLSSRNYGTLILNAASAGSIIYIGSGNSDLTIRGDLYVNANVTFSPDLISNINLAGDFVNNGVFSWNPSSAGANRTVLFNGTSTQNFTNNGIMPNAAQANFNGYTILPGSTVVLQTDFPVNQGTLLVSSLGTLDCGIKTVTGAGTFTLSGGGTLKIGSPDGISTSNPNGNVQTTTRNYNGGGIYEYTGNVIQWTGDGLPTLISGTLKINNTSGAGGPGVRLFQTTAVTGTFETVSGNFTLLNNDFAVSNYVQTGTLALDNNHIVTNGLGSLVRQVNNSTVTFPVGPAYDALNSLTITYAGNNIFAVRVQPGLSPAISFPTYAINRTWVIYSNAMVTGVNLDFQYVSTDANAGALPQPMMMELLLNDNIAWSIIFPGIAPTPVSNPFNHFIATATGIGTITTTPYSYALGKNGGYSLPVDFFITCSAEKRNNGGLITWNIADENEVFSFEVERSVNGTAFQSIATVWPVSRQLVYHYTDPQLAKGISSYRIRVNRRNNTVRYSNIAALVSDTDDILITSMFPNPVMDNATVLLSSAKAGIVHFTVTDLAGKIVKSWQVNMQEGTTVVPLDLGNLRSGLYHLAATTAGSRAVFRFIKQ